MDYRKAEIVGECWVVTRNHDEWAELLKYGDIGFPLAYAMAEGIATVDERGEKFIEELYDLIVATLDIDPATEYADFEAILDANIEKFGSKEETDN